MFKVNVGVSNHHIHLTKEAYEKLFKTPYNVYKELSQKGQFATDKMVTIVGPKGQIERLRFLGPYRKYNQVEVSKSDAFLLGINPPVRQSGDLENSESIRVIGEDGEITLDSSVIIAEAHVHMSLEDLDKYGVKNKEQVLVKVNGNRVAYIRAIIKADETGVLELHIDRDEANALLLEQGSQVEVIKWPLE